MNRPKLPWSLRGFDITKPGWHANPTAGYELMFEYLRISPSYELARKANMEGLTKEEEDLLPSDFDLVMQTYKLLGDVQAILVRQWWLKRGLRVFGNPYTKPKVHKIIDVDAGKEVDHKLLSQNLNSYMGDVRRDEGMSASVLMAIPIGLKKTEIKKQIDRILDELEGVENNHIQQPIIKLQGQRLRKTVLLNGLKLLWFRSAKPNWEEWRLGVKAEVSKTYAKLLDIDAPRRVKDSDEAYNRELMTKVTHRALRKCEAIAENAARGRFPSEVLVEKAKFDYRAIAKRIQKKNAWEKLEKERLLKLYLEKQKSN